MTLMNLAQATVIEPSKASRAPLVLFATVELAYRTQGGSLLSCYPLHFPFTAWPV